MLLVFIICHLSVFVAANPFHKYPFVFLLDVGNEELEKTNSEQIRVSVPGGSIALRYPAIGYGNTIGHIRVSGIDFGTDLKASIVDGGPGYKYVVLVFMGKPGTPYDAVLTIQTVFDNNVNVQNIENMANSEANTNQSEEDKNNSESLGDTDINNNVQSAAYIENSNAELTQSSSNMYSYFNNESVDDTEDDDDNDTEYNNDETEGKQLYSNTNSENSAENLDFEDVNNAKDIHSQYADDIDKEDSNDQLESVDLKEANEDESYDGEENLKAEPSEQQSEGLDKNSFTDYEDFQAHLNYGNEIYSQEEYQKSSNYQEDPLDYVDPYAEEFSDGVDKYKDLNNNNYINADDSYAIAY